MGAKRSEFLEVCQRPQSENAGRQRNCSSSGQHPNQSSPDLRHKVMSFVMNPQFAYLLFMGSLGLLYFEFTHPGMIAPGVLGAIGLGISLVAMHMLDVETGGLVLIFLGLILMILELFVSSFGVLGAGGVVAFFVGSLFLFDPEKTGYTLPLTAILPTTLLLGACMLGVAWLALSTRELKNQGDFGVLIGKEGRVSKLNKDKKSGQINVNGEIWKFKSDQELEVESNVVVSEHKGFTLIVKSKNT